MNNKVTVLAIAIMLGLALARDCAHAGTLKECEALADLSRDVATLRDRGVDERTMEAEARRDIRDADIREAAIAIVITNYGYPQLTPNKLAATALESCLDTK